MSDKPHWISANYTAKNQKFICSACKGECKCIAYERTAGQNTLNHCDYKYCPRCGEEMDLEHPEAYS